MSPELIDLLKGFGYLTAGIWGAVELIGYIFKGKIQKELLALIIGIPTYVALTLTGIFEIPNVTGTLDKIVVSALFGLLALGTSAQLNDKLINPFKALFRKE